MRWDTRPPQLATWLYVRYRISKHYLRAYTHLAIAVLVNCKREELCLTAWNSNLFTNVNSLQFSETYSWKITGQSNTDPSHPTVIWSACNWPIKEVATSSLDLILPNAHEIRIANQRYVPVHEVHLANHVDKVEKFAGEIFERVVHVLTSVVPGKSCMTFILLFIYPYIRPH
jgi:hypothetical protein